MWRRDKAAAQRFAERRQREDEAPRLSAVVPHLESLRLEVTESRSGISTPEAAHIRRIVVEHAPALFLLSCHDTQCKDGGHDITNQVLSALRARQTRFEGEDACNGALGSATCQRVLHFVGVATYRPTGQRAAAPGRESSTEGTRSQ
jgi:hypothetical protein